MSSNKKKPLEIEEATYGKGQQIVDEPDTPEQLQKEHPRDELPQKVVSPDGRVLDLDTEQVSRPELVEISGRKIDVSEFGEKGIGFLKEMYEEFLAAVQEGMESKFEAIGDGGANELKIIEEAKAFDHNLIKHLETKTTIEPGGVVRKRTIIKWDQHRTFEDWLGWAAATLRWRINYELKRRADLGIIGYGDLVLSKEVLGECLVVVEKYLRLSDTERLIGI